MKYSVGIGVIISIIIFLNLSFSDNQFTVYFNILLFILFYLVAFLSEYSVFNYKLDSDFKIRSQKKLPKVHYFLGLIFLTILIYANSYKITSKIFYISFIWTSFILEIIMYFLYKKKKPFTLFIKKEKILLIDKGKQERDIAGLNRVLFDRFSKKFELRFDIGYKLKINTRVYKKEDVDKLLEKLQEKSKYSISIPNNYKKVVK